MVPPGQKDVSSDAVIFSTSPVPLTSGLLRLSQSDQPLTQVDRPDGGVVDWADGGVVDWPDGGVVGTTLTVVGDGVVTVKKQDGKHYGKVIYIR